MVKKSILAIAILAMLATVTLGQDSTYDPQTGQGQTTGQMKFDNGWPKTIVVTWTPIEICCIKINLKVGYFIEVKDCGSKKIDMVQVNCPAGQGFPCYKGCTTISVRSNFQAQLGLVLKPTGTIINGSTTPSTADDKWKAYFVDLTPPNPTSTTWIIQGNGQYQDVQVCVEAWEADIFNSTLIGQYVPVGVVCITAIPTATATCP